MAFCTAADVESFALIDFNSDLESHLTNELIPLVEDVIREYLGYEVDYGTHTELFSGNQTRELFLSERPVIAVTSVVEDGTTLTYGNQEDYLWYENGRIRRIGSRWSFAYPDNISVTYTAGYDTGGGYGVALPRAFKVATARASARVLEAALVLSAQQEPGEISAQGASTAGNFNLAVSERIGDYSADYSIGLDALSLSPLTASDMSLLSPYRKSYFV